MSNDNRDEPLSEDEARLLADVGRALGPDVLPAGLVARAEGLVSYWDVDRELVELLDDAAPSMAGSRGPTRTDVLAFELAGGAVSLELSVDGDEVSGQLLAGDVVQITLEPLDGPALVARADALGRFSLRPARSGPARLRLDDGSGRPLATDWFFL